MAEVVDDTARDKAVRRTAKTEERFAALAVRRRERARPASARARPADEC